MVRVIFYMFLFLWLLIALIWVQESYGADYDTTTIKIAVVETCYEFGFSLIDTVSCTAYCYRDRYKNWYLKGIDGKDYYSDKPVKVLFVIPRKGLVD